MPSLPPANSHCTSLYTVCAKEVACSDRPIGAAVQQYALQGHSGGLQQRASQVGMQGVIGCCTHVPQSSIQLHQHWVHASALHMMLIHLRQHCPPQVKEHCLQAGQSVFEWLMSKCLMNDCTAKSTSRAGRWWLRKGWGCGVGCGSR